MRMYYARSACERLLPDHRPVARGHPRSLVEAQRPGVVGGNVEAGLGQAPAREGGQRVPQQCASQPPFALIWGDGEQVDAADRRLEGEAYRIAGDGRTAPSHDTRLPVEMLDGQVLGHEVLERLGGGVGA